MFNIFQKNDLQAVEKTLKLLAVFHAMPATNEQFTTHYRHLLALRNILASKKGKI